MTHISWCLDKSDSIDLIDPLGSIEIVNSHGQSIHEKVTYLDSWFDALIRGVSTLASAKHADVDLFVEPRHLVFRNAEDKLTLSYGNQQVHFGSLSEFRTVLHAAAVQFIDELREYGNVSEMPNLQLVLSWLSK